METKQCASNKLFLLVRIDDEPEYDVTNSLVVRAQDESGARAMVVDRHWYGDEGADTWTDPQKSTCRELTADIEDVDPEEPGLVIRDFAAG